MSDEAGLSARLAQALLPHYAVGRVLGEGASGWVVEAEDRQLGRRVAIKVGRSRGTPRQRERFAREGRIAGGLQHPNIVRTHNLGIVEGHPYLVLELVPGAKTLRDTLEHAPVTRSLEVLRDVLEAMAYAHERGVVHRDLKPENVLVNQEGRGRVTDFGVATMSGLERVTQTGALVGTPYYMAPEQFEGDREAVGPHSDVWALGIMLYEASCGRRPFSGGTLIELATQLKRSLPQPRLLPGVPPGVAGVIERALAKQRSERYANAGELAAAFDAALAGARIRSRGRGWVVGGILGAVIVAGGAAWALAGGSGPGGGESPGSRSQGAEEPPGADAWREIFARTHDIERLQLGEAWLESFPDSALRAEVTRELERQRLNLPRWSYAGHRGETLLVTAGSLLGVSDAQGGVSVATWTGERNRLQFANPVLQPLCAIPEREELWVAFPGTSDGCGVVRIQDPAQLQGDSFSGSMMMFPELDGMALSPDGELLALAGGMRTAVFKAEGLGGESEGFEGMDVPELGSFGHGGLAVGLAFLLDGSALAVVSRGVESSTLHLVSRYDLTRVRRVPLPFDPTCAVALPRGKLAIAGEEGQLAFYDRRGKLVGGLHDPQLEGGVGVEGLEGLANDGAIHALALSPRGLLYSVGEHSSNARSAIRVWDLAAGKLHSLQGLKRRYRSCCVSVDGRYLACGTQDGDVELWDRWVPGEWEPTR